MSDRLLVITDLLAFVPLQLVAMDGSSEERELCIHTLDTFYGVTWNQTGVGFAASTFSWPAVAQMSAYVGRAEAAYGNITGMISHWYNSITPSEFTSNLPLLVIREQFLTDSFGYSGDGQRGQLAYRSRL